MPTVSVRINHREYALSCDDGQEEQLVALADEVDERVRGMAQQMPHAGEAMLFLLSALTLADELSDARRQSRITQARLARMEEQADNGSESQERDQAKLAEMESAMAATLKDVAERIEKIAARIEIR